MGTEREHSLFAFQAKDSAVLDQQGWDALVPGSEACTHSPPGLAGDGRALQWSAVCSCQIPCFVDNGSCFLFGRPIVWPCCCLVAKYIMRNAGLEETQAGIKIARRSINNLRYADDTTLMAESEEELKSLLMKVKVESVKVGSKLNIQNEDHGIRSHHFMGNRWGNSGNSVRLYFSGLQNHCRW